MCTRPRKQIDTVLHNETHRSLFKIYMIIFYKNVYMLKKDRDSANWCYFLDNSIRSFLVSLRLSRLGCSIKSCMFDYRVKVYFNSFKSIGLRNSRNVIRFSFSAPNKALSKIFQLLSLISSESNLTHKARGN